MKRCEMCGDEKCDGDLMRLGEQALYVCLDCLNYAAELASPRPRLKEESDDQEQLP